MLRPYTVFVIGAGASRELNLPDGVGLMHTIGTLLRPASRYMFAEDYVHRVVEQRSMRINDQSFTTPIRNFINAAGKIRAALPVARSIDTYLESEAGDQDVVFLGKLGIAMAILRAEENSFLKTSNEFLQNSWYIPLGRMITSGFNRNNVESILDNVSFVVFNYDRCLECYLFNTIKSYFAISDQDVAEIMRRINIIHPYGKVGRMPWEPDDGTPIVAFGGEPGVDIEAIAEGIQTYTESARTNVIENVRRTMAQSETLVFLGFGFLTENIRLLRPEIPPAARDVLATTFGLSSANQAAVASILGEAFGVPEGMIAAPSAPRAPAYDLVLHSGTCRSLIDDNSMFLEGRV